jgi:hypothetical protein
MDGRDATSNRKTLLKRMKVMDLSSNNSKD